MLQSPTDVTMENNLSRVVAAVSHALTISTTRALTVSFLTWYSGFFFYLFCLLSLSFSWVDVFVSTALILWQGQ